MILGATGIRVNDSAKNKKGTLLSQPSLSLQQATSGAAGAAIPAGYIAAPVLANFFALIMYDDFTFDVQSFNNLTPLKT